MKRDARGVEPSEIRHHGGPVCRGEVLPISRVEARETFPVRRHVPHGMEDGCDCQTVLMAAQRAATEPPESPLGTDKCAKECKALFHVAHARGRHAGSSTRHRAAEMRQRKPADLRGDGTDWIRGPGQCLERGQAGPHATV